MPDVECRHDWRRGKEMGSHPKQHCPLCLTERDHPPHPLRKVESIRVGGAAGRGPRVCVECGMLGTHEIHKVAT